MINDNIDFIYILELLSFWKWIIWNRKRTTIFLSRTSDSCVSFWSCRWCWLHVEKSLPTQVGYLLVNSSWRKISKVATEMINLYKPYIIFLRLEDSISFTDKTLVDVRHSIEVNGFTKRKDRLSYWYLPTF